MDNQPSHQVDALRPLSARRVAQLLRENDTALFLSDAQQPAFFLLNNFFWVNEPVGSNLETTSAIWVEGMWRNTVRAERAQQLRGFIDLWNDDHMWTQGFFSDTQDGRLTVRAHCFQDFGGVATDRQIRHFVGLSLRSCLDFFEALEQELEV